MIQEGIEIFDKLSHLQFKLLTKIHVRSNDCVHCGYIRSATRLYKYESNFNLVTVSYKVEDAAYGQNVTAPQNSLNKVEDIVLTIPKDMKELNNNIKRYVDVLNNGQNMSLNNYNEYLGQALKHDSQNKS